MNTITQCIEFANANKLCFLATLEKDQPHVRALGFWFADESGFYFQTGAIKKLVGQLRNHPQTEVCFFKPDGMAGVTLRVSGKVEFVDDINLKERVMEERPFLKNFGLNATNPDLILFRIAHGEAHFWTMETNLKPKEMIKF